MKLKQNCSKFRWAFACFSQHEFGDNTMMEKSQPQNFDGDRFVNYDALKHDVTETKLMTEKVK